MTFALFKTFVATAAFAAVLGLECLGYCTAAELGIIATAGCGLVLTTSEIDAGRVSSTLDWVVVGEMAAMLANATTWHVPFAMAGGLAGSLSVGLFAFFLMPRSRRPEIAKSKSPSR